MSNQAIYPFFFKLSEFDESRNTAFLGDSEPFYVDALLSQLPQRNENQTKNISEPEWFRDVLNPWLGPQPSGCG